MKMLKKVVIISTLAALSISVWGCGAVKKEEPDVPTKYIEKADDAVEQYNEGVDQINKAADKVEDTQE